VRPAKERKIVQVYLKEEKIDRKHRRRKKAGEFSSNPDSGKNALGTEVREGKGGTAFIK